MQPSSSRVHGMPQWSSWRISCGIASTKRPDDVLVGQEVGALDRVPCMQLARVAQVGAQHRRRAALGADRVGAHQLHLGDDADVNPALESARDLDRGAEPGQPGAQDHNVVLQLTIHQGSLMRRDPDTSLRGPANSG